MAALLLGLAAGAGVARAAATPEFQVNGYTWGSQAHPVVAADDNGNFVIVWEGPSATDSRAVVGRRFGASGLPRGDEFVVNSSLDGVQDEPAVAVGPAGDFVVAWETDGGAEGTVAARRFDAAGRPLGGEFVVSSAGTGYQGSPAVARTSDGGFVVVWASERTPGNLDVVAQRFGDSGERLGSELRVNSHTPGLQSAPSVGATPDGGFVVVWQSWTNGFGGAAQDGSDAGIYGQRFGREGRRAGDEFRINTTTLGPQQFPDVAVAPSGSFLVTWQSPQDDSGIDVMARRFAPGGAPSGPELLVNAYTAETQQRPRATAGTSGDWIVTWESAGRDGWGFGIAGRRLRPDGRPAGGEFVVNTHILKTQYRPDVAALGPDRFVVAWASQGQDRNNYGVYGRVLDRSCLTDPTTLCLAGGRFEVRAEWDTATASGFGGARALTADTGYFWFFDSENVEIVVKVLDGCGLNDRFWIFAAGLTDVGVRMVVTDTLTGARREYRNPRGTPFQPIQDTSAVACSAVPSDDAAAVAALAAGLQAFEPPLAGVAAPSASADPTAPPPTCSENDATLCLGGGRFAVRAAWRTPRGEEGVGHAVRLTADTGTFWFFTPENVELVVKALDGCGVNRRRWFFAAGLTDVEVTLTVTDTVADVSRTYVSGMRSPFAPLQDTGAFATCQ